MRDEMITHVRCDLCAAASAVIRYRDMRDTALAGADGVFTVAQCVQCGLVFLDPQPDEKNIGKYYAAAYTPYQRDNTLIAAVKNIFRHFEERRMRRASGVPGSVIEIGCSRGDFLAFLKKRGWRVAGLEMDADAALAAAAKGLTVRREKFEDAAFAQDERYDCVVLAYVLEHLSSPKAALAKTNSMLVPGGIAVISIPNYDSWERKIFGRWWHCFDVPRHFFIFTEAAMRAYARQTGFTVRAVRYSYVPNDWIGGIARMLRERRWQTAARFFGYQNLLLACLFLPVATVSARAGRSSRFTFILEKLS